MGVSLYLCVSAYDADGNESIFSQETIAVPLDATAAPADFAHLRTGFGTIEPNPAHGRVEIAFALAEGGEVEVQMLDVSSRLVARPVLRGYARGLWSIDWESRDSAGERLSTGVYLLRLMIDGRQRDQGKLILLR